MKRSSDEEGSGMPDARIAGPGDVPQGEIRGFEIEGTAVAVANDGGTFRAFHNECTHKRCALDDGDLEDGTLTCACHGSVFDLETGAVESPPATEPIAVYPVRVEGDDLIVTLP
jgi:nitrite reductase/ring-hydroxylating ferredoxin subunit